MRIRQHPDVPDPSDATRCLDEQIRTALIATYADGVEDGMRIALKVLLGRDDEPETANTTGPGELPPHVVAWAEEALGSLGNVRRRPGGRVR